MYGHLWKVKFQLIGILLAFFVWFVNCSFWSVNYESYFGHFEICGQFLYITGYFALYYIWKLISTGSRFLATFCWQINCWVSLNYKVYFRHVQKLKNYLYLMPFNVFSFRESSILTIKYGFSFFLVSKLCKAGLQIIHLNWSHLRFLGSVDIGGFL